MIVALKCPYGATASMIRDLGSERVTNGGLVAWMIRWLDPWSRGVVYDMRDRKLYARAALLSTRPLR